MDTRHDQQEQQETTNGALLRLADIKGSLQMLQAVKSPAKQVSNLSKNAGCEPDNYCGPCINCMLCLNPHAEYLSSAASHCDH